MAEQEEKEEQAAPGDSPPKSSGGFLERLKKAPPWVWIGLIIALLTLIVGFMAYQHAQQNPVTTPPAQQPGGGIGQNPPTGGSSGNGGRHKKHKHGSGGSGGSGSGG